VAYANSLEICSQVFQRVLLRSKTGQIRIGVTSGSQEFEQDTLWLISIRVDGSRLGVLTKSQEISRLRFDTRE